MSETIVVPTERAGLELDEFLCLQFPGCSKGHLRQQVRDGAILVDGIQANPSQKLRRNQVLIIDFELPELPQAPQAPVEDIPLLYEDDDVLVVFKPAGLAVEPERWAREKASLAGALLALARRRGADVRRGAPAGEGTSAVDGSIDERFRAVHRLDKDTSGCLLVAKHLEAERFLRGAFENGEVEKRYLALVEGEYALNDGEQEPIDLPLGPDVRRSGRMVVPERGGKAARTLVGVVERFRGYTLLACHPLTGRTHQIRVHLSAKGFPLVVDPLYGRRNALMLSEIKNKYKAKRGKPERPLIDRLTLHAQSLAFAQPTTSERIQVEAPLPRDFANTMRQFRKVRSPL